MKRILLALTILGLLLPLARQAEAQADVSVDIFYDNLNDGSWLDVSDYGYVWQPNVAVSSTDWRPYADGYWAYSDRGWTWVSNEDFGWATYHYGRWARLADMGWVWVPGYEWAPAWVSWRTGGDYVGWAPLPPTRERVYEGRAITGHVDVEFDIGPAYYNFVDVRYIGEPVLRDRIFAPSQNITYITKTVNVTNISYQNSQVYNYGPDYSRISRYSTRPIQRLTIEREAGVATGQRRAGRDFSKVQGDKFVVSAPLKIKRSEKRIAPKAVKAKIEKPNFERGWSGISDPKAKAELQQKMKTEDARKVPPTDIQAREGAAAKAQVESGAAASPAASAPPASANQGKDRKGKGKRAGQAQPTAAPAATAVPSEEQGKDRKGKNKPAGQAEPSAAAAAEHEATTPTDTEKRKDKREKRKAREEAQPGNTPAPQNVPPSMEEEKGQGKRDAAAKAQRQLDRVDENAAALKNPAAKPARKAEREIAQPTGVARDAMQKSQKVHREAAEQAPIQRQRGERNTARRQPPGGKPGPVQEEGKKERGQGKKKGGEEPTESPAKP